LNRVISTCGLKTQPQNLFKEVKSQTRQGKGKGLVSPKCQKIDGFRQQDKENATKQVLRHFHSCDKRETRISLSGSPNPKIKRKIFMETNFMNKENIKLDDKLLEYRTMQSLHQNDEGEQI